MSELVKFKYLHDGGPMECEFVMEQTVVKFSDGIERRAVIVHVSDLTDHFRLQTFIPREMGFEKNKIYGGQNV